MLVSFNLHPVAVGRRLRYIPLSPNETQRMHWGKKKTWTDAWVNEAMITLINNRQWFQKLPIEKANVVIRLKTIRPMDTDNAYAAIKCLVDSLKRIRGHDRNGLPIYGAGIIIDDDPTHLSLLVESVKVEKKDEQGVEIIISSD